MAIKTFILMGRPGCGKGRQATVLKEKTNFDIFSTGGRFREIASQKNDLGGRVGEIMNSGALMPNWFASFLFQEKIFSLNTDEGIIFEGVGRMEPEARLFSEIAFWLGRDFRVLHLNVSEATVKERISKRLKEEGRVDDDPLRLQTRFDEFEKHTLPAINYFRSIGKVIEIDGMPAPEKVFEEIWNKISSLI